MIGWSTAIIASFAASGLLSPPGQRASLGERLQFQSASDTGMAQELYAAVAHEERDGDCSLRCYVITVHEEPLRRGDPTMLSDRYYYRVEISETRNGGRAAMTLQPLTGSCPELEIDACGRELRARIDAAVEQREAGLQP